MRWIPALVVVTSVLAWAAPAEAAPKVAVVDLVACMESHPEAKKIEDRFRTARSKAQDALRLQDERLKDLKRKLDELHELDPDRPMKERQYELQMSTAKFNFEWDQRIAIAEYVRGLEGLYRAVRGEVARYARDNGIEVVLLKTDPKQPLNAVDPKDFALKSRLRVVVHAEPGADITDAITAILKTK
jgi:Skp family chaperone for outer membrane proteins